MLHNRWQPIESRRKAVIFHGIRGPFRERLSEVLVWLKHHLTDVQVLILTPVGLVPISLEDLNPFAHIDAPSWVLQHRPEGLWIQRELERLGLHECTFATVNVASDGMKLRLEEALEQLEIGNHDVHASVDREDVESARHQLRIDQAVDKQMVLLNLNRTQAERLIEGCSFVVNREGRVKNVNGREGLHLLSPRLRDGGISLTNHGAQRILDVRTEPLPTSLPDTVWWGSAGKGPAVVVVSADAEPFVRKGRNVFHGFVAACDGWLAPGEACLITDEKGALLGHGLAQCTATEMAVFTKGIAVKTRGGVASPKKE